MKNIFKYGLTLAIIAFTLLSIQKSKSVTMYSLTVKVNQLRNSKGHIQFTLYNKDGTIPDEKYKKYYRKKIGQIKSYSAYVTFKNLPKGRYAVNILHDENEDGKIKKGWIMPIEGIGFSNFTSIGFTNRPSFKKASFYVSSNMSKRVKVIYL